MPSLHLMRASGLPNHPMPRDRFERGAVVAYLGKTWIVWAYPRARYAEPFALPVVTQTRPLHRSHVRINLGGGPLIVQCLDGLGVLGAECVQIGQLDDATIALIDQTIRRASEASDGEWLAG